MLLCNLEPIHGLYNGTCLRLIRSTCRILKCHVLNGDGGNNANNVVLIPRLTLDSGLKDSPVPFHCFQFPVHLAYAMTIYKAQGQTVKHVGLNLSTSVFSHGQLYVALSCCTHPRSIEILFPDDQQNAKTTNVVWNEVFRNLELWFVYDMYVRYNKFWDWKLKQPMSLTHLKVLLGCLLEEYNEEGGENHQAQKSYSEELWGKLQENLTEVLWWWLWPLYATHIICTWLYWIYQYQMHKKNPKPWAVGYGN